MKKLLSVNITLLSVIFVVFSFYKHSESYKQSESEKAKSKSYEQENSHIKIEKVTNQTGDMFKSTVLVNSTKHLDNFGSGYVIGKNTVVTNKHVVEHLKDKPGDIVVRVRYQKKLKDVDFVDFQVKEIILPKSNHDVAILHISNIGIENQKINEPNEPNEPYEIHGITKILKPVKFNTSNIKQGDVINVVGYGDNNESNSQNKENENYGVLWHDTGTIDMVEKSLISFNTVTQRGSSGSPIFDDSGYLIAMSVAGNKKRSFGFLIDQEVKDFINKNKR